MPIASFIKEKNIELKRGNENINLFVYHLKIKYFITHTDIHESTKLNVISSAKCASLACHLF